MSNRTDWGIFRQDGSRIEPVAAGNDAYHAWRCPDIEWVHGDTEVHPITGEDMPVEPYARTCPWRAQGAGRDVCARCGLILIYP